MKKAVKVLLGIAAAGTIVSAVVYAVKKYKDRKNKDFCDDYLTIWRRLQKMQNNNVIATEVAEKQRTSGKARFTAYMQGMKKLERKAQMQKEAMMKGGTNA